MEPDRKTQQTELKSFFSADKTRYSFYFDIHPESIPQKVEVYLEARTPMEEALLIAIDQCNSILKKDSIELVRDISLFRPRLVGKNFKPKTDMPCLSLFQKICDLKISEVAVQIPNREKAIHPISPTASQEKEKINELTEAAKKMDVNEEVNPSTKI